MTLWAGVPTRGYVALVWDGGFLAPPNWRSFFERIDLRFVVNNLTEH